MGGIGIWDSTEQSFVPSGVARGISIEPPRISDFSAVFFTAPDQAGCKTNAAVTSFVESVLEMQAFISRSSSPGQVVPPICQAGCMSQAG